MINDRDRNEQSPTGSYEPPALVEIGTLHQLTKTLYKDRTGNDGVWFEGPLGPVS